MTLDPDPEPRRRLEGDHRLRLAEQFGRFVPRCSCGWTGRSFPDDRQAERAWDRHTNSFEEWESPYDAV